MPCEASSVLPQHKDENTTITTSTKTNTLHNRLRLYCITISTIHCNVMVGLP